MPELRRNPITNETVIIAPSRSKRPMNNLNITQKDICPFCPGNEHLTPKELYISTKNIQLHKNSYWSVRVIPNKYPVLTPFDINTYGIHEVIIDTPSHNVNLHNSEHTQIEETLHVIRSRVSEIEQLPEIKYVQVFKNTGKNSGASQSHSHWQIIGLPFIPTKLQTQNNTQKCQFCQYHDSETHKKERIIEENECFTAFTPIAARFPYEASIIPNEHIANITTMNNETIKKLTHILRNTIIRLNTILPQLSYNICFIGAANTKEAKKHHHWQLQIIPRVTNIAGFELATGCYINEIEPEKAAAILKANLNI